MSVACESDGATVGELPAINHPAMFHSVESLGAVTLDIQGDRLDATFLDENGAVQDWFTIQHTPWTDLGFG